MQRRPDRHPASTRKPPGTLSLSGGVTSFLTGSSRSLPLPDPAAPRFVGVQGLLRTDLILRGGLGRTLQASRFHLVARGLRGGPGEEPVGLVGTLVLAN